MFILCLHFWDVNEVNLDFNLKLPRVNILILLHIEADIIEIKDFNKINLFFRIDLTLDFLDLNWWYLQAIYLPFRVGTTTFATLLRILTCIYIQVYDKLFMFLSSQERNKSIFQYIFSQKVKTSNSLKFTYVLKTFSYAEKRGIFRKHYLIGR